MSKLRIQGLKKLEGTVTCQGCKNAALPILAAALLTDEEVVLRNVPNILDIKNMVDTIRASGVRVWSESSDHRIKLQSGSINKSELSVESAKKIRYSLLLPSALAARFSSIKIPRPGGDKIGTRKIDSLILGLESLGARFSFDAEYINVEAKRLKGNEITLYFPSVSATEGTIIAASMAEGKTIINNVAKEPEIVDLAEFLNSMGAKISGAGTDIIKIEGVKRLHGTVYNVMPDRIVTSTLMMAASITKSELLIENVEPSHVKAVTEKLREIGVKVYENNDKIRVDNRNREIKPSHIVTQVYPGFPTDVQPIIMSLLTIAKGESTIDETIYDNRFQHVNGLCEMGAKIRTQNNLAIITGVDKLFGAQVVTNDIRSGASLVLAGLAAEGITEISNIKEIDRGYEAIEVILSGVGADIERVK